MIIYYSFRPNKKPLFGQTIKPNEIMVLARPDRNIYVIRSTRHWISPGFESIM